MNFKSIVRLIAVHTLTKLMCIVLILICSPTKAQVNIPAPIPIVLSDQGHIILKAQVNGVEGNFIFDTGAGLNLMTKKFADKIANLDKLDGFYTGHRATGEALQVDLWRIRTLAIGTHTFEHEVFSVLDINIPIDGLISLMPFKQIPVQVDFENKLLTLWPTPELKDNVKSYSIPIQVAEDRGITLDIFVHVKVDDLLTLQMLVDSGAGFNVLRLPGRYMNALKVDSTQVRSVFKKSSFDMNSGNKYYFTKLSKIQTPNGIGVKKEPAITFIDGLIYEGVTSMEWLGNKIIIDIPKRHLLVVK